MKKQIVMCLTIVAMGGLACRTPLNPLDKEAQTEALKYWEISTQKCGDFRFTNYFSGQHPRDPITLQFKGQASMSCAPSKIALTEADRLNGIEWKGECTINFAVFRAKLANEKGPVGEWTNWKDPSSPFIEFFPDFERMPLSKLKGQWQFTDQAKDSLRGRLEPVPCDQANQLSAEVK